LGVDHLGGSEEQKSKKMASAKARLWSEKKIGLLSA